LTATFHEAKDVSNEYADGIFDRVTPGGSCEVVNWMSPCQPLMLVRFNVKSVEPTKTSGGREAVEGATLKAKPGPCVVE
jgi:hypothetical protein